MKPLNAFFQKLITYVQGGSLARDFAKAASIATQIGPLVKIAGDIVTGLTPSTIDDKLWGTLTEKYPNLFNGVGYSPDEIKLTALAVLTELVKNRYPGISTTVARLAAQAAYPLNVEKK
jgi:hypothetical protein